MTTLYESRFAALAAAQAKAGSIREDWDVELSTPVRRNAGWVDPYYRDHIPEGRSVMVVYLRASGDFARGWEDYKGKTSRTYGFAWVEEEQR